MLEITTLCTSYLTCMYLIIIIFLVHLWHSFFFFIGILLVFILSRLESFLFSLELSWWKFSVLVGRQIYLCCLGGHLPLASDVWLWALQFPNFFASFLTLLVGKLFRSMLLSFIVFETGSSSLSKNQKISLCRILAVSCGYLANATWVYTALYHQSTDLSPCLKLVSNSNLALTS